VVMVSSLTAAGTPVTVEALLHGAFDVVAKPAGLDPHEVRRVIHADLVDKVATLRASLAAGREPQGPAPAAPPAMSPAASPAAASRFAVLAVGASTGGPEALREVLPRLPADLPVPVLVVQHIPAAFSAALAARLDDLSLLSVVEAADGMPVERGRVYIAPGGRHLRVERAGTGVRCRLDDGPPVMGCRPSFDVLLESATNAFDGRVVTAVLTGMGSDGLTGCRALKARGGVVVAQHRDGCTVWGMPKAVEQAGLADAVVRLGDVAGLLTATLR